MIADRNVTSADARARTNPPWSKTVSLSVVVPVFNSELSLPLLVQRLRPVLGSIAGAYELILVDDGSSDASWEVIELLSAEDPWVRGIRLMRNYGQHNALLCGIREARYDVTVTMDDDLQNPPEEIQTLVGTLLSGFDLVYGTPPRQRHGWLRDAASYVTKLALQGAMGAETARSVSAFRAIRTDIVRSFSGYCGSFVSLDVLLTWGTSRVAAVHVPQDRRVFGDSHYTWSKLMRHALNMITGFTTLPLQVATFVGFAFACFGLVTLAFVLGRYLWSGASVPGFPFLASVIAIFSGAQLFALGIIGEYLARMHFRLMDRPSYAVRTATPGVTDGR